MQSYFTTSEIFARDAWPQAALHTQWPGTGLVGDPIFDAFYASQVQLQINTTLGDRNNRAADIALLDAVGPAVLLTHSQSGPYGWVAGDARPELVRGVIALEPEGPPFVNEGEGPTGPPRVYGVTRLPLRYDPPVGDRTRDLKTRVVPPPDGQGLAACTLQAEPARRLVGLAQVPIVVVTGEASYHAPYDHCMVRFLRQAGVGVEWMELGRMGVRGNGHFMFMERNCLDIAGLVEGWLERVVDMK